MVSADYYVCEVSSVKKNGMCQILAIDKNGIAKYLVLIAKDGQLVSSKGALSDNERGPDLAKSHIEVNFGDFGIHLQSTSYGQSLNISQDNKLLTLEELPKDYTQGNGDGYIKLHWIDDLKELPKTKQEFMSHFSVPAPIVP